MSKVQLNANVTPEMVKALAKVCADAAKRLEAAKRSLLSSVVEVVQTVGQPLTAAQWDKQVKPDLTAAFARHVKSKALTEATADAYVSKLKTVGLAILNGVASPIAGESFAEFYGRAKPLLLDAKAADGSPVWPQQSKRGPKVTTKAKGTAKAAADADASAADQSGEGFNRSPKIAAALILTGGNEARARALCVVLESYADQFDKFTASLLTDADKADAAKLTLAKGDGDKRLTPQAPKAETAMEAALKNAKPRQRKAA